MKRLLSILALLLLVIGPNCSGQDAATQAKPEPQRILWLGSAWFRFHDLAPQCSAVISGRGGFGRTQHAQLMAWPLHALFDEPARPKMQFYGESQTVAELLGKVRAAEFDVLVATIQLEMLADEKNAPAFERTLAFLSDEAKRRDARLVFAPYANDFGAKPESGMNRLPALAARHGAVICPWWTAMKATLEAKPGMRLFDEKVKGHPGLGSVYLNACVFVFCLTDTPPEKLALATTFHGWADSEPERALPADEAKWFQAVAWKAWVDIKQATVATKASTSK